MASLTKGQDNEEQMANRNGRLSLVKRGNYAETLSCDLCR